MSLYCPSCGSHRVITRNIGRKVGVRPGPPPARPAGPPVPWAARKPGRPWGPLSARWESASARSPVPSSAGWPAVWPVGSPDRNSGPSWTAKCWITTSAASAAMRSRPRPANRFPRTTLAQRHHSVQPSRQDPQYHPSATTPGPSLPRHGPLCRALSGTTPPTQHASGVFP